MSAKLLQLCPTLCDPMDRSPPGSSVYGMLQARILEWVAMLSSRGSSQPRDWTCVSYISCIDRFFTSSTTWEAQTCHRARAQSLKLCPTLCDLWTVACQAPLSMGFSRHEYWSGLHALLQRIYLTQGSNPCLLHLLHCRQVLFCWATQEAQTCHNKV